MRIAPTPSGYLHWGNAMSFVVTAALANRSGASLLLRIDDLDDERVKQEHIQDVFDTLNWLGLDYYTGPKDALELASEWSQKCRMASYSDLIEALLEKDMVYPCDCSRKQIAERGGLSASDHECRSRKIDPTQNEISWRIRLPESCVVQVDDALRGRIQVDLNSEMPDFVVRRRDGIPGYQIASLADDLEYGIDLIVRGEDLLASTAAQLYLADTVGSKSFRKAQFIHHPLIKNQDGSKLSKSEGAEALKTAREKGMSRAEAFRKIAGMLNVPGDPTDIDSFSLAFDPEEHLRG